MENEVSERGERDCYSARMIGDRADKRALFVTDITEILRVRGRAREEEEIEGERETEREASRERGRRREIASGR